MLKILYAGTVVAAFILCGLLATDTMIGRSPIALRLEISIASLIYLFIVGCALYAKAYLMTKILLLVLYFMVAVVTALIWTINAPISVMMFGFSIISTGFLLGSRWIALATISVILTILLLHIVTTPLSTLSDSRWTQLPSTFADVIGYTAFYSIFALTAWLSGRKMETMLTEALQAEAALKIQRRRLARQLEAQSQTLYDVRIEEMKQLYRFAELGQLTTIVLHDLANQISILSLDIDEPHDKNSPAIEHTKQSIAAVESMISQARGYIDDEHRESFNAVAVTLRAVDSLRLRANRSNVRLSVPKLNSKPVFELYADPLRLSQVISILVTNAIQASASPRTHPQNPVDIRITLDTYAMHIIVADQGSPIPQELKSNLFKLQTSTKENGNGVGLFIAHKVIETHFHGKLWLEESEQEKRFIIELPSPKADPETFYGTP